MTPSPSNDGRRKAQVAGWGKYVPARVMHNRDLEPLVDTTDEWIIERTGIRQRHIAAPGEGTMAMAIAAGRAAVERGGGAPEDLGLVLVATCTPDEIFPSIASRVQAALGAGNAGAFDINAACAGFAMAMNTGVQFIETGAYEQVLVIGADAMSRILDWTDRSTCILFGDGAGAVLLKAGETPGVRSFVLRSDGSGGDLLFTPGPCNPNRGEAPLELYLQMNGREVFRFAIEAMKDAVFETIRRAGMNPADVDLFIPHQANLRIIRAAQKWLSLPDERVFVNVDEYGNTSSASIPIALAEAADSGRLRAGDNVLLVGFGGGLAWGATLLTWTA